MANEEALRGNDRIEQAIRAVQAEPTQELLAHALTVLRRCMRDGAQLLVALDPQSTGGEMQLGTVRTADGKRWFAAFTSFDEQMAGGGTVMSAFTAELSRLFELALNEKSVEGLIIDPYRTTLMLDKTLIRIVLGTAN